MVEGLPINMSNIARLIFKTLHFTNAWNDIATCANSISLRGDSGPPADSLRLAGWVVANEEAIKEWFGHKGASAMKLCARCQDVVAHNMSGAADGVYVPSTELDLHRHKTHTDDNTRGIMRELARLHAAYIWGDFPS